MAHLWINCESEGWMIQPLSGEKFDVSNSSSGRRPRQSKGKSTASLVRSPIPDHDWVLITGSACDAHVNGLPLITGVRALLDKDEIRIPGVGTLFFSTETLASVSSFPETSSDGCCPRCRQKIAPGAPAVRCPGCLLWYHQSDDLPCWTYSDSCLMCECGTDLNSDYTWTPEEL